ncbi:ATPase, V0 complex, subunit d [Ostreococcus tauri]|uniref:V-type proton ATPase subunit n=1 Tax=Ostreococcus tauri TaxID=70448 RepID=A0A090N4N8_OSTTA|nr:ATPase, V0 complex, subunit d [Ostreococcus tauri]CEG01035.1 ATPase, V0 complex, subunit d [Ostreococcus tauri]|eukprot:XP_022840756.1 ATPase, V0 complex, subunit d [Ostreococcus tauri]
MFNRKHGFSEAFVRGCHSKRLSKRDYEELGRCDSLEDVKTYLESISDYSDYLRNVQPPVKPEDIVACCKRRHVKEFNTCQHQASPPLSTFLEYLTYGHMIDNLMLALNGMLHGRSSEEILDKCSPIGLFDSLPSVVISGNVQELYRLVLVDTPLAKYLSGAVSAADLDELNVELIRNVLYKEYLQDFMKFCSTLDLRTNELMKNLLDLEADRHAIRITVNSFGTELSKSVRTTLYTNFGTMHPDGFVRLATCETVDEVKQVLVTYPGFHEVAAKDDAHDVDRGLRILELESCQRVLAEQFNLAAFYAFSKFQENELSNLMWLTECIAQRQKSSLGEGLICIDTHL